MALSGKIERQLASQIVRAPVIKYVLAIVVSELLSDSCLMCVQSPFASQPPSTYRSCPVM